MDYDDSHYETMAMTGNGWKQSGPSPEQKKTLESGKVLGGAVPPARHGLRNENSRLQSQWVLQRV